MHVVLGSVFALPLVFYDHGYLNVERHCLVLQGGDIERVEVSFALELGLQNVPAFSIQVKTPVVQPQMLVWRVCNQCNVRIPIGD